MGLMRSRPKPLGLSRARLNRTLGSSQSHASMTSSASVMPLPGPLGELQASPIPFRAVCQQVPGQDGDIVQVLVPDLLVRGSGTTH